MIIQKRRRHRWPLWPPILLILITGICIYIWQLHQQVKNLNSLDLVTPIVQASDGQVAGVQATSQPETQINNGKLEKIVNDSLDGTTGTYAVIVKNLKTGEHFELNQNHVFDSASLYKLWIMATVYQQEIAGNLTDDQELSESVQSLNNKFGLDSEVAELTDGVIDYSVHDALEKMITISDNYTALLLTSKIRLSTVANFLKQNNFNQSTVGTSGDYPMTSADDIESFFEKLYKGELADPEYTQKMLDLLKMQKLNGKIPKDLPDNIVIAHKTGELDTVTHDAGIVYSPNGDYIIVIMSDSDNPPAAEGRISDVSQAIYGYFNSSK